MEQQNQYGGEMRYIILLILLSGCTTIATQSDDGKTLTIKGQGKAKFENGAEIEGGSYMPKLPKIEVDQ